MDRERRQRIRRRRGGWRKLRRIRASGTGAIADSESRRASNKANFGLFWAENRVSGAKQSQSGRPRSQIHSTALRTAAPISDLRLSLADRATWVLSFVRNKPNFARFQAENGGWRKSKANLMGRGVGRKGLLGRGERIEWGLRLELSPA
jgi:hypothetical protein